MSNNSVSGWVTKEGGSYKSWKRRFVVIEGTDLAYYKKDNKKEKCGFIPLIGAVVQAINYKSKKHCFEISTSARAYHVCANSDADLDRWIKALNDVIKPGGKPIPAPAVTTQPNNIATSSGGDSGDEKKPEKKKLGIEDFTIKKVIGQGSFGKVLLVTKKDGSQKDRVFAMKVLNKSTIISRNEVEHTKSEKKHFNEIGTPIFSKTPLFIPNPR